MNFSKMISKMPNSLTIKPLSLSKQQSSCQTFLTKLKNHERKTKQFRSIPNSIYYRIFSKMSISNHLLHSRQSLGSYGEKTNKKIRPYCPLPWLVNEWLYAKIILRIFQTRQLTHFCQNISYSRDWHIFS
jgi:hypothetical protein